MQRKMGVFFLVGEWHNYNWRYGLAVFFGVNQGNTPPVVRQDVNDIATEDIRLPDHQAALPLDPLEYLHITARVVFPVALT